jgi:hypothetical protein
LITFSPESRISDTPVASHIFANNLTFTSAIRNIILSYPFNISIHKSSSYYRL